MRSNMRKQEGDIPWIKLGMDLLGAYILTMVILVVLALLVYKVNLSKEMVEAGITITYILSCFVGGSLAGKQMKQKRFMWGIMIGIAYYLILLCLSIVVNQSVAEIKDSVFTTLILCVGGGMLGGMLS